ncbi:hypothetical protein HHK36_019132 [Tetracentron sinense]|uniref:glutathione transferase n=1 Tax=Tetracentron sinense TaxID=13715 RepID=A0A834YX39_TETSI|nr:hypothetical protein HHK36_019132 [Tetracentron sinense]
MAEEVKVFGAWGSPFSHRVELALKLKGVPYEFIEEDLANKSSLLLKYNPIHKKIPVLLHNGKPIAESLVILEYIDETWKDNPILPEDPYERAMARFWCKFMDEKCMPALWKAYWIEEKERAKAMEEAFEHLKTLENELKGKFFGGETIGLVDIACNWLAFWIGVIQEVAEIELVNGEKFPILCKWIEEFINYSPVKESLPHRENLLAYLGARREALFASTSKQIIY